MYVEICPFVPDFPIYLNICPQSIPDDSLDFLGCLLLSLLFISNFINLDLYPPHFSQICQRFVNLVYFSKKQLFVLLIVCFTRSLNVALGCLFEISLGFFIYALMAVNFPLWTAFAISHRF
jgi:hypothetical protein